MKNYILVKITNWSPAFGEISLQSEDNNYERISTISNHTEIFNIITKITGEKNMNDDTNNWYAKIDNSGTELLDIRWSRKNKVRNKNKIRDEKLDNILENKLIYNFKRLFKRNKSE